MKTAIRLITMNCLTLLLLAANPAQAALMSCSVPGPGGTSYLLSDASESACFSGNDTNQIDADYSLFGMTGWVLSDKNEVPPDGDGVISFTTAPTNDDKSGSWAIDTLAGLDNIVITLKGGNGFGAFLLDLTVANPLSGTWASDKELSHASIYYNGEPTEVPEPSIFALIGLGLLGIGMARRRTHK